MDYPIQKRYLTYYVGETGVSFAYRTMEHIKCYLNGLYRVYDPHQFAKGKKILIWGGMWKPNRKSPDIMHEYLTQYQRLSPLSYGFLDQFRIFLAPIDGDNQRIRQRVEAAIASTLIEHDGVVGSFQDNDIKYWPKRPEERPITVKIKSHESIMGLTDELTV